MKKLLLLLLCVPLMFTTCKKEDDNPDNNNGTFLENQDGTVWIPLFVPDSIDNWVEKIGFYDANSFMVLITNFNNCMFYNEGVLQYDSLLNLNITENTDVKLKFDIIQANNQLKRYSWTIMKSSNESNSMNLEAIDHVLETTATIDYVKSTTETNLSCN